MANNYYTLPNSEMYENSPAVVNFQRFVQRRDTVQQQQQDVPNSGNSGILALYSLVIKGATKGKSSSNLFGDIRKYF